MYTLYTIFIKLRFVRSKQSSCSPRAYFWLSLTLDCWGKILLHSSPNTLGIIKLHIRTLGHRHFVSAGHYYLESFQVVLCLILGSCLTKKCWLVSTQLNTLWRSPEFFICASLPSSVHSFFLSLLVSSLSGLSTSCVQLRKSARVHLEPPFCVTAWKLSQVTKLGQKKDSFPLFPLSQG